MPIPSDTHTAGDTGHITDHNAIADTLTALTTAVAAVPAETARAQVAEAAAQPKTTSMLIPVYVYPNPATFWTQLTTTAPPVKYLIANPASGPGSTADPFYTTVISAAQAAGVVVLGYVDTNFGAVSLSTVQAQVGLWQSLYGVTSIFFDRASSSTGGLAYCTTACGYVGGGGKKVLNHGTIPAQGYAAIADILVVFEDVAANWAAFISTVPAWFTTVNPAQLAALVYAAASTTTMTQVMTQAQQLGIGNCYVTDQTGGNPWAAAPSYFTAEVTQALAPLSVYAPLTSPTFTGTVTVGPSGISSATGTKFDGATDDHTALISAETANRTLQLPAGTASIGATVTMGQNGLHIRGAGMYSTTIQASAAITMMLYGATWVNSVEISDLTIDGNNLATLGLGAYGNRIGRFTMRRCRLINFPGVILQAGYAANYLIEDCVAEGGGLGVATFFYASVQPIESLILRRNRMSYMFQGITIGSAGFHAGHVEITDNVLDGGWYLFTAAYTGSGGTVTYTSGGLTDTAASFGTIPVTSPAQRYVRALSPRQTSTFTTTAGTYITDTAAAYITNGVKRGEIIRSGTAFAVIANVISNTALHVEEWLSQTTYLPVTPPASGASYVLYAVYLGTITASTATTLTVVHGAGGGGGGWFDLAGANVTPTAGTLYEVLSASGGYQVFCTQVTEKLIVSRNRVRRSRYDSMELFGNQMIVTDNIVEDGQDEGIVIKGQSTSIRCNLSVIQGNLLCHNGSSGLFVSSCTNIEVGPNQYYDNCWTTPPTNNLGQFSLYEATNTTITGGHATYGTESIPSVGLNIQGATTAGIAVHGFTGTGHTLGDIYVTSLVPAATCDLFDVTGVITYQVTTNGQRLRVKGTGVPTLVAAPGSTFTRTDGGSGTTLYVKESGNGSSGWTAFSSGSASTMGGQVAYAKITSSATQALVASAWTAVTGAPSITLPSDGNTYQVTFTVNSIQSTVAENIIVGLGISTSTMLATATVNTAANTPYTGRIQCQSVVGSGQAVTIYGWATSGTPTLTLVAGGATGGPCELAAYRVV